MAKQLRGVFLALIFSFLYTPYLSAQEIHQARLTPPETEDFPYISTYLDVFDADGNFVYGIDPEDVNVLENGRRLAVTELNKLRAGVQFVLAINPGAAFNIRDLQGNSRYDYVYNELERWAQGRQGTTLDDLSLLTVDGPVATHLSDPTAWISTIQPYQPENSIGDMGLEMLGRALELAAETPVRPGMGRAVLFITSLPEQDITLFLESLAVRARQREVRIFVWLVTSASLYNSPNAIQLQNLANQTGGEFFAYSGIEPLPDLEDYLEPLRCTYFLLYESRIITSGRHQLAVQIRSEELDLTSAEQEFEIEVLPPNLAFISHDLEIKRKVSTGTDQEPGEITPGQHHFEVLIEFPDGYVRPLERTRLFVDGQIEHQNLSHPFDQFTWDLSEYTSTDSHLIQVEVMDILGLTSTSIEKTILVSVEQPVQRNLLTLTRNRSLVVGAVVLLTGCILLLILVMGGRVQPGFLRTSRNGHRRSDPVTQPVQAKIEPKAHRLPDWFNRLYWPQRSVETHAPAMLVRISESGQSKTSPPIPITADEITFGRDPTLVTQILEDPSVEAIHARLRLVADKTYHLYDEQSTAGTWINYTPVSAEGAQLEHGDLIHIGRVGFRFSLREPVNVRKPIIIKKEQNQ